MSSPGILGRLSRGLVVVSLLCLQLGSGIELETQSVYYGMIKTAVNNGNNSVCTKELTLIYKGIDSKKRWAIKLMDASGAPSTGLYWGNTYWLGSRQQCLASASSKRVPVSRTSGPFTVETPESLPPFPIHYYGAYFTHNSTVQAFVHYDHEVRITLGLCLPSSCTETEIYGFLEEYFESGTLAYQEIYETSLTMEGVKKTEDDYAWTKTRFFKIFIVGVATTLALCIVGTIYDVTIYKSMVEESQKDILVKENGCKTDTSESACDHFIVAPKKTPKISFASKFIRCFSVDMNARNIFSTPISDNNKMLPLYGIRFFTIIWIVVNHGLLYMGDIVFNRSFAYYISDHLIMQPFTNATFTVDTFISMSGFLLGYVFLESEMKKAKAGIKESMGKKMSIVCLAILNRVARLLPAYLFTLGFAYTTSAIRHRQTVFWSAERNDINCQSSWWKNVLFINNLFPKAEMCMSWSWYLSSEMQNFVLSVILLTLATKYLKQVMFAFASIFIVANAYTGYVTYAAGIIPFLDSVWSNFDLIYSPPSTRVGPYFIGVAGGCILQYFNRQLPLSRLGVALCWAIGLGLGTGLMFGFADKDMSLLSSALYVGLSRSVWALSIVWLLLACLSGNGGFINSFLSLGIWIPLGKVSYCVYLINPLVIKLIGSYTDKAWECSIPSAVMNGLGYIMLSFIIAFVFSILFEAPFFQLTKLLLGDEKRKAKERKPSDNNNIADKKEL